MSLLSYTYSILRFPYQLTLFGVLCCTKSTGLPSTRAVIHAERAAHTASTPTRILDDARIYPREGLVLPPVNLEFYPPFALQTRMQSATLYSRIGVFCPLSVKFEAPAIHIPI